VSDFQSICTHSFDANGLFVQANTTWRATCSAWHPPANARFLIGNLLSLSILPE
jgi:hypothetical protein